MYNGHFGLREAPFGITPDTSFFFACPTYQEALNTLLVATRENAGFIKVTGEVGTGKTLLCRKFLGTLGGEYVTAYVPNPYLDPHSLLVALANELELDVEKSMGQHNLLKSLTLALLSFARQGKKVVVCLDEAQAMPVESLESLRLLTNLETEKRKLLQVVLFGQPELNAKLEQTAVRQLNQRIIFQYQLSPLDREEVEYYVLHRLSVAGYSGRPLFARAALNALFAASGGIPRLVNIIAHKALMLVYGERGHEVLAKHVKAAAADTPAARRKTKLLGWLPG